MENQAQPAPGEVVHLSPRDATYVTPCCGQAPFDLRRTDRMTNDPSLVTCGGPEPKAAPGDQCGTCDGSGMLTVPDGDGEESEVLALRRRARRRVMSAPAPVRLLTSGEAAAMFGVESHAVSRRGATGRLVSVRTIGGHQRFFEAEVRALLAGEPPEKARGLGLAEKALLTQGHGN